MLNKVKAFIKKETVFCISALCAVATMFFVPPGKEYIEYIDFHVLYLLMCLMAVVAGFKSVGAFRWLTYKLLSRTKGGKMLGLILVLLPFFASMLVTNDVALLVFVPFTVMLLQSLGFSKSIVPVIVLQTVGANLGSMATPVGNPQNLFLYSAFDLGAGEFFSVTLPLTAVSLVVLGVVSLFVLPSELPEKKIEEEKISNSKYLIIFALLFVICLLTVFRVISHHITAGIIIATLVFMKKDTRKDVVKDVDFMLILTFVCFFIVSGNLGRVDEVKVFLQSLLSQSTLLTAVGTSQIISNVPAAVLLSGFTDNWKELLAGVNIGGLGTPIASLASLITLKLYMNTENAKILKFLSAFTVANIIGLVILLTFETII